MPLIAARNMIKKRYGKTIISPSKFSSNMFERLESRNKINQNKNIHAMRATRSVMRRIPD